MGNTAISTMSQSIFDRATIKDDHGEKHKECGCGRSQKAVVVHSEDPDPEEDQ
jgi:hypothetical protein